jgi:hypothetical protein
MTQTSPTLCFEVQSCKRREKEKGGQHAHLFNIIKKETYKRVNGVVESASFFIQPKWKWRETTKQKKKT